MRLINRVLAASVVTFVLISGASMAMGESGQGGVHDAGMPVVMSHDNSLIVSNSRVTVQFQGFKPMLHIFYRNDSNTTGFTVDVRGVYELNSTGATVAVLSTVRAFPDLGEMNASAGIFNYSSGVAITYDNASKMVNITFSLTSEEFSLGPMTMNRAPGDSSHVQQAGDGGLMHPLKAIGPGSIAITFHINASTAHVKFDLSVSHWTWLNNTGDKLAMVVAVTGHHEIEDSQGNVPTSAGVNAGDSNGNGNHGANQPAKQGDENTISVMQGNFMKLGFVSWGSEANATYGNGTTARANVTVKMFSHGIENDGMAHIWFIFSTPPGWNTNYTKLSYDPTVGLVVNGAPSGMPSPGTVAAAGALVLAAAVGAGDNRQETLSLSSTVARHPQKRLFHCLPGAMASLLFRKG